MACRLHAFRKRALVQAIAFLLAVLTAMELGYGACPFMMGNMGSTGPSEDEYLNMLAVDEELAGVPGHMSYRDALMGKRKVQQQSPQPVPKQEKPKRSYRDALMGVYPQQESSSQSDGDQDAKASDGAEDNAAPQQQKPKRSYRDALMGVYPQQESSSQSDGDQDAKASDGAEEEGSSEGDAAPAGGGDAGDTPGALSLDLEKTGDEDNKPLHDSPAPPSRQPFIASHRPTYKRAKGRPKPLVMDWMADEPSGVQDLANKFVFHAEEEVGNPDAADGNVFKRSFTFPLSSSGSSSKGHERVDTPRGPRSTLGVPLKSRYGNRASFHPRPLSSGAPQDPIGKTNAIGNLPSQPRMYNGKVVPKLTIEVDESPVRSQNELPRSDKGALSPLSHYGKPSLDRIGTRGLTYQTKASMPKFWAPTHGTERVNSKRNLGEEVRKKRAEIRRCQRRVGNSTVAETNGAYGGYDRHTQLKDIGIEEFLSRLNETDPYGLHGHVSLQYGFLPIAGLRPWERPGLDNTPVGIYGEIIDQMDGNCAEGGLVDIVQKSYAQLKDALDYINNGVPEELLMQTRVSLGVVCQAYFRCHDAPFTEDIQAMPNALKDALLAVSNQMNRVPWGPLLYSELLLENWVPDDLEDTSMMEYPKAGKVGPLYQVYKNQPEKIHVGIFIEIERAFAPAVGLVHGIVKAMKGFVRAKQEKDKDVQAHTIQTLKHKLVRIRHVILDVATVFRKFHQFALSDLFVDSTLWGRTYATFTNPVHNSLWPNARAAGGLQATFAHVLDTLLGRELYDSFLGQMALKEREWLPLNHHQLVHSLKYEFESMEYSLRDLVLEVDDEELRGTYNGAVDAYAGPKGLLYSHQIKAWGYLEQTVQFGRTVTTGHSHGLTNQDCPPFDPLESNVEELRHSREERAALVLLQTNEAYKGRLWRHFGSIAEKASPVTRSDAYVNPFQEVLSLVRALRTEKAKIKRDLILRESSRKSVGTSVRKVTLNIEGTGLSYQPGDRLRVLPTNFMSIVLQTLNSIYSIGFEEENMSFDKFLKMQVDVTSPKWRDMGLGTVPDGFTFDKVMELGDFLQHAQLRPLEWTMVENLLNYVNLRAVTNSSPILASLLKRDFQTVGSHYSNFEFWDLLQGICQASSDKSIESYATVVVDPESQPKKMRDSDGSLLLSHYNTYDPAQESRYDILEKRMKPSKQQLDFTQWLPTGAPDETETETEGSWKTAAPSTTQRPSKAKPKSKLTDAEPIEPAGGGGGGGTDDISESQGARENGNGNNNENNNNPVDRTDSAAGGDEKSAPSDSDVSSQQDDDVGATDLKPRLVLLWIDNDAQPGTKSENFMEKVKLKNNDKLSPQPLDDDSTEPDVDTSSIHGKKEEVKARLLRHLSDIDQADDWEFQTAGMPPDIINVDYNHSRSWKADLVRKMKIYSNAKNNYDKVLGELKGKFGKGHHDQKKKKSCPAIEDFHGLVKNLGNILPPLQPRQYSISSAPGNGLLPKKVMITVSPLKTFGGRLTRTSVMEQFYTNTTLQDKDLEAFFEETRQSGTGSTFLRTALTAQPIAVDIVRPALFEPPPILPDGSSPPALMFGSRSGIAPFMSFIEARRPKSQPNHLFLKVSYEKDISYRDQLDEWLNDGHLQGIHIVVREEEKLCMDAQEWYQHLDVDHNQIHSSFPSDWRKPPIPNIDTDTWSLIRNAQYGQRGIVCLPYKSSGFRDHYLWKAQVLAVTTIPVTKNHKSARVLAYKVRYLSQGKSATMTLTSDLVKVPCSHMHKFNFSDSAGRQMKYIVERYCSEKNVKVGHEVWAPCSHNGGYQKAIITEYHMKPGRKSVEKIKVKFHDYQVNRDPLCEGERWLKPGEYERMTAFSFGGSSEDPGVASVGTEVLVPILLDYQDIHIRGFKTNALGVKCETKNSEQCVINKWELLYDNGRRRAKVRNLILDKGMIPKAAGGYALTCGSGSLNRDTQSFILKLVKAKGWRRFYKKVANKFRAKYELNKSIYGKSDFETLFLQKLAADGRLGSDTFTSIPRGRGRPAMTYAEIARSNTELDCKVVYDDRVYDITGYLLLHPGGEFTLSDKCGTDLSEAFEHVHYGSETSEVHGILSAYFYTNLKPPNFQKNENTEGGLVVQSLHSSFCWACQSVYTSFVQLMHVAVRRSLMFENDLLSGRKFQPMVTADAQEVCTHHPVQTSIVQKRFDKSYLPAIQAAVKATRDQVMDVIREGSTMDPDVLDEMFADFDIESDSPRFFAQKDCDIIKEAGGDVKMCTHVQNSIKNYFECMGKMTRVIVEYIEQKGSELVFERLMQMLMVIDHFVTNVCDRTTAMSECPDIVAVSRDYQLVDTLGDLEMFPGRANTGGSLSDWFSTNNDHTLDEEDLPYDTWYFSYKNQ